ncbi:MAG: DegV family protein [Clostridiales bacterium]|jgi:DegV family protein with EDD domain|nr:DegV family protein [Clostridiales bacterium]
MADYILSCCSTADLSNEYLSERNIHYVCFHFTLDGEVYPDDLGKTMPIEKFYERLKAGGMPTSSQVNVLEYTEYFESFLKEGKDILHLDLSSGISGSYGSACVARDELAEKYPQRKIYVVDSLGASSGYGLLVAMAADLRDNGKPIDYVRDWAEENKLNIHHWVCMSDLFHLKRGGRISAVTAVAGTILNICPLINVNFEGKLIQRKKIKGKKQITQEMVNLMERHAKDGLNYSGKCFVSHSACLDDAKNMAAEVEKRFKNIDGGVQIFNIGTVIGTHTGPGTFTCFFYGDKRVD